MHSLSPASDSCAAAYEALLPELDAFPACRVQRVNLDVLTVVARIVSTLPRLTELRAQAATELPHVDFGQFEKLADYAWALTHADVLLRTASEPSPLEALLASGRELRALLVAELNVVSLRHAVQRAPRRGLQGGSGKVDLAADLVLLAARLEQTEQSPELAKTVSRARALSALLVKEIGQRRHTPEAVALAADRRNRAFTLLLERYDHARRYVQFLRYFEGDAERYAPSLYARRAKAKPQRKE